MQHAVKWALWVSGQPVSQTQGREVEILSDSRQVGIVDVLEEPVVECPGLHLSGLSAASLHQQRDPLTDYWGADLYQL